MVYPTFLRDGIFLTFKESVKCVYVNILA